MVQNIAIIGINREVSYEVAKLVANSFDMHFLDTLDLFEFDNKPRTLSDMLKQFGLRYFRQKEKRTIKYVSGFSNSVINLESGMAAFSENFNTLKSSCLVVYLKQNVKAVKNLLQEKKYCNSVVKNFYCVSEKSIVSRDKKLSANADIVIEINDNSVFKISSEVIRQIKLFYGVK